MTAGRPHELSQQGLVRLATMLTPTTVMAAVSHRRTGVHHHASRLGILTRPPL
jgi:hypothetical protein